MSPMANLSEIFFSIQGEGLYVGMPQIFVRFSGCHVNCAYCDSPEAKKVTPYFNYEQTPGMMDFVKKRNLLSPQELVDLLKPHLEKTEFVSITGGEPLLQVDFLHEFLPLLKANNAKVYLETNGMLFSSLQKVMGSIDIIAMDIKLHSTSRLKIDNEVWEKFLGIATSADKEVFVKAVVGSGTTFQEIRQLTRIVKKAGNDVNLVLQPVSPFGEIFPPEQNELVKMAIEANRRLKNVLVIPQTHKMIKVK